MNKQQLIDELKEDGCEETGEFETGFNAGLERAIRIIEAQPEPTGTVVPLDALKQVAINSFLSGYESGHDDTVEGMYGCCEERAEDCTEHIVDEAKALAVPAGNQWQPIDEAPTDGSKLLLGWYQVNEFGLDEWRYEAGAAGCTNRPHGNNWLHGSATHFQYLPEPSAQEVSVAEELAKAVADFEKGGRR